MMGGVSHVDRLVTVLSDRSHVRRSITVSLRATSGVKTPPPVPYPSQLTALHTYMPP